jgi:hypothetical protein
LDFGSAGTAPSRSGSSTCRAPTDDVGKRGERIFVNSYNTFFEFWAASRQSSN